MDNPDIKNKGWKILNWKSLTSPPEWLVVSVYIVAFFLITAILAFIIIPTLYKIALLISFGNPSGDDLRAALLGVGAIVATPFVVWRIWTSHISALSAQKQATIAADTLANTTFSKAVEQLGAMRTQSAIKDELPSKNLESRLGAIFTLTELANTEKRFHFPVVETLAAYVRENSRKGKALPDDLIVPTSDYVLGANNLTYEQRIREWLDLKPKPSSDILAILYSLSILNSEKKRDNRLDLSGISIRNSEVQQLKFSQVALDSSQLECAMFWSVQLSDVLLQNVKANCSRFFTGTIENCFIKKSCFNSSGFDNLKFKETSFVDSEFCFSSMSGTQFLGCFFGSCDLTKTYLRNAKFITCELHNIDFFECDLTEVEFSYSELDSVRFQKEKQGLLSIFGETSMVGPSFAKTEKIKLDMAWLTNTNLSSMSDVSQGQIDEIFYATDTVILPPHLRRPKHWEDRLIAAGDVYKLKINWRQMRQDKFGIKDTFLTVFDVIES